MVKVKIKVGDFKASKEQKEVINNIIKSNKITEGKYVEKFERNVEKFIGVKHAIAVTNGTVSLQLLAFYLKKKVVCVPALTFPATLNAFLMTGYRPILCDIDPKTLCIDIDKLTEKEKKSIDIIVPVSLLGYSPDMDKIMEQAKRYNWIVIEDFAESFGSVYRNKRLGSIGHFGSSSFFISHVFQGGELGVITTDDDKANEILRKMKVHGRVGNHLRFQHDYVGSNYKTNEFCAGLAYIQLKHPKPILDKRRFNAWYLTNNINNKDIKLMPFSEKNSLLGFPMFAKSKQMKDKLCKSLNKAGVETRDMFPCLANQKAYNFKNKYPNASDIEKRGFYIGCHQGIDKKDLDVIIRLLENSVL